MPPSFRYNRGADPMKRRMQRFKQRYPDRVEAGLAAEGEIETTEVKKRTPVDRGPLRGSVHMVGPIREGRRIYILIVAGGPAAPYAYYVHEDPDAFHKVGQWKYIESVILESRPHMGRRVLRRIELTRELIG
jgi:hypothetical protein